MLRQGRVRGEEAIVRPCDQLTELLDQFEDRRGKLDKRDKPGRRAYP